MGRPVGLNTPRPRLRLLRHGQSQLPCHQETILCDYQASPAVVRSWFEPWNRNQTSSARSGSVASRQETMSADALPGEARRGALDRGDPAVAVRPHQGRRHRRVTLLRSADAVARPSDYGAACGDQEHTVAVRQVLDGQGLSSTAVHGGAVLHPP